MDFKWYKFQELSATLLYEILQLRAKIFVVEQQCIFLDLDDKDQNAIHLLGYQDNKLITYLRLFPPTEDDNTVVFGRVITALHARGSGHGKALMTELLNYVNKNYPNCTIRCSAQAYLEKFYQGFGFTTDKPSLR